MGLFKNYLVDQWAFQAVVIFLLVGSVFAVVVGAGLMLRSGVMFRFFAVMNRWVSTREMMGSVERPRDVDAILHRQRRAVGATIVVGAGLSLALLLRNFDVGAIVDALRPRMTPVLVELAARAGKWLLVAGHVGALAFGIAMIFFPAALATLEQRTNQWYSWRKHDRDLDLMHMSIDQWVECYPRTIGFCVLVLALFVIVSLGGTFLSRA